MTIGNINNINSIFQNDWWLDAVAPKSWDSIKILNNNNNILACLPYVISKRKGFTRISMPPLTQNLGPWIAHSSGKYSKQLSFQKEMMNAIIAELPNFDVFSQKFHYSITNWLPFYWAGFSQTTYYTYVIENINDLEKVWSDFQENIRREIRKAEKILTVDTDMKIDDFIEINKLTFQRQNMNLPYAPDLVKRIDATCKQRNSRKLFFAKDDKGNIHAAIYIIWDENSAYYLLGGADPLLRNSGASSLLMWEAIKFAATVTKKFDFEGSMLEPVERFFRGFGAEQKPYFFITKVSKKYKNYSNFKSFFGR